MEELCSWWGVVRRGGLWTLLGACFFFIISCTSQPPPPPLIVLHAPSGQQDAVCLDGSSPAYSLDPGSGSGKKNWIVYLQGGGWCDTLEDCQQRSLTALGSSKYMNATGFGGFLSSSPSENPGFYNWNRVSVRYCDGGSFTGNADSSVQVMTNGQTSTLHFRGQAIFEAIVDDLLTKGLACADKAILAGESAGGLAAFFQCNRFQEKLSPQTDVKCLCDCGFFMDIPDLAGLYSFRGFFQSVVTLHNVTLLPSACTSQMSLGQCFFPEYNLAYIKPPLFFLQSLYDTYEVGNILAPASSYSNGTWAACIQNLASCSSSQLSTIQEQLSDKTLEAVSSLIGNQKWGLYMVSCYYHVQATLDPKWNGITKVNGMTPSQSFSSWYYTNEVVQEKDCAYPCNPTCIPQ